MQTRRIGALDVSLVGLGCNNFGMRIDEAASAAVVDAALEAGVTFFDTADIYGNTHSEEFLGRALGGRRRDIVIATKFGYRIDDQRPGGAQPDYIRRAVEDSLRRLGTDRIDLYQLHTPDPSTPIADTLGALDELVRAGMVREIGCSNFSAAQLREAEAAVKSGGARFVSVQNEYSLLQREAESDVLPACEPLGVAFLPYFPLASGLLTGKYSRSAGAPAGSRLTVSWAANKFLTEERIAATEKLDAFARARGRTLLELAMSWLAARSAVASIIAGATTADQVRANARSVEWRLTADDVREIDRLA